jgi:NAD(P)-dependent dehydrogenase (short-subunit alcohol dehydrogenase family)
MISMALFAVRHGMIWVGLNLMPADSGSKGSVHDLNRLGSWLGAMAQSNVDEGPEITPIESDRKNGILSGKARCGTERTLQDGAQERLNHRILPKRDLSDKDCRSRSRALQEPGYTMWVPESWPNKGGTRIMKNPLDFTGKVALVTGAASGMGLATAQAFADAGAAVVMADFREEIVKSEAQKLASAGHKAMGLRCDVSDDAQVEQMVSRTVSEFGRLDAAFNNAGVMAHIAPTAESTREDWDRVIGINLRGVWSSMKYELRQMERQGSGAIVNNASVGALTGNPGIGSYIASKHGVIGLTRTAALEYIKKAIYVNAVNPGLIDTQIARDVVSGDESAYADIAKSVPIQRAGRPEEIAAAVLWLCSPAASYVVGHALTVDGGMTVV